MTIKYLAATVALGALVGFGSSTAMAQAVLLNAAGDLALGVNTRGHLNAIDPTGTTFATNSGSGGAVGIAAKFANGLFYDATSPGCLCEGWGVSANGTMQGYASIDSGGISNLTLDSFTSSATNITSAVHLTSDPGLSVTQSYGVAPTTDRLFRDRVTITNNTGGILTDVKYVRVMDWDVPPTEFSEFVTIQGVPTTTTLEYSNDNGFCNPGPLFSCSASTFGTENVNFVDIGPSDHGAYFRFNFGALANGASTTFDIFYGAAAGQTAADLVVSSAALELYSYGQNSTGGVASDLPQTYIFGFKGVGGVVLIPDPTSVPEPMSLTLLGLGLLATWRMRKQKRASAVIA